MFKLEIILILVTLLGAAECATKPRLNEQSQAPPSGQQEDEKKTLELLIKSFASAGILLDVGVQGNMRGDHQGASSSATPESRSRNLSGKLQQPDRALRSMRTVNSRPSSAESSSQRPSSASELTQGVAQASDISPTTGRVKHRPCFFNIVSCYTKQLNFGDNNPVLKQRRWSVSSVLFDRTFLMACRAFRLNPQIWKAINQTRLRI